eukprot:7940769-Lingulodinium_polyedra.AAC.1
MARTSVWSSKGSSFSRHRKIIIRPRWCLACAGFAAFVGAIAVGGQTAVKWKRDRACGVRFPREVAAEISTLCHVTRI